MGRMIRVALIHWNEQEGRERAMELRRAGCEVVLHAKPGPQDLRCLLQDPPAAVVIDLSRMPSHGRAVALALRQRKSTRGVPLLFMGGDPRKVAGIRALLPDAAYGEWGGATAALGRARAALPAEPVAPGIMAGYSGTPLPKKLGIKPGCDVALLGAPADFERTLGALPGGVSLRRDRLRSGADLILLFAQSRAKLERHFDNAMRALAPRGRLWIAWPKQASGALTDLTQAAVRSHGLHAGLVDYKICSIDQTWSGLLFVRRAKMPNAR
jgi:hypothetical protein